MIELNKIRLEKCCKVSLKPLIKIWGDIIKYYSRKGKIIPQPHLYDEEDDLIIIERKGH